MLTCVFFLYCILVAADFIFFFFLFCVCMDSMLIKLLPAVFLTGFVAFFFFPPFFLLPLHKRKKKKTTSLLSCGDLQKMTCLLCEPAHLSYILSTSVCVFVLAYVVVVVVFA